MSLADKLKSGTKAPTTESTSSTGQELHLYIDAFPVKTSEPFTRLEDYIAPMAKEIADKGGVVDVRELRFGEGTTALIAAVKRNPPSGVVVASSMGLSGTVAESLLSAASLVVRSTR